MSASALEKPIYLVFLNERTIIACLWLALTGNTVVCLPTAVIFGPLRPLMDKFQNWLTKRYKVRCPMESDPRLASLLELRVPRHHDNVYARSEPWLDEHLSAARLEDFLNDDSMPLKHAASTIFYSYMDGLWFLRWYCQNYRPETTIVVGADAVIRGAYHRVYGEAPTLLLKSMPRGATVLKTLAIVGGTLSLIWSCSRPIYLRPLAPRHIFLGSDFSGHPRDRFLWQEIREAGHDVVVVFRNRRQRKREALQTTQGFSSIDPSDGRWSARDAIAALAEGLCRLKVLILSTWQLEPVFFVQANLLPGRRMKMRSFLAHYRFKYFWVRDDYSQEHILRSQELRKKGGKSIGVAHGLPISATVIPMFRYIDCDTYFVHGMGILRHYGDRWSQRMKVHASGSLGLTREFALRLAQSNRNDDIIFHAKAERDIETLCSMIEALASAFSERKIYFAIKKSFGKSFLAEGLRAHARQFPNVQETEESIYELFLKARYLVTDPSTIAAEALQFGLYVFMLDCDGRASLYFRDFPEFCESDPAQIVRRINGLEDGSYKYRFQDYESLINREGCFLDQFRAEVGLPPLQPGVAAAPHCIRSYLQVPQVS